MKEFQNKFPISKPLSYNDFISNYNIDNNSNNNDNKKKKERRRTAKKKSISSIYIQETKNIC